MDHQWWFALARTLRLCSSPVLFALNAQLLLSSLPSLNFRLSEAFRHQRIVNRVIGLLKKVLHLFSSFFRMCGNAIACSCRSVGLCFRTAQKFLPKTPYRLRSLQPELMPAVAARFEKIVFSRWSKAQFVMTQTGPWPFLASLDSLGIGDFACLPAALFTLFFWSLKSAQSRDCSAAIWEFGFFSDSQRFFLGKFCLRLNFYFWLNFSPVWPILLAAFWCSDEASHNLKS